ncbi:SIMPL domain-containing protein [Seohaeicola saemankumensis]|nr:SIMPL domain-containing protein [Seohaeicola saemankumensis]MCA0870280.1 SIMPL domain-containing protein [Seohaeicola saemankumensis]
MKPNLIAAAALAFLVAVPALAETSARQITVTGEGRVETVPDMATITLGVSHRAKEARTAMAQTSDSVTQIIERLGALGIAPRDVQTRQLTLNPVWSDPNGSADSSVRIAGFQASNTLYVRVRDLPSLGAVLEAVIEDGANEFNSLQFTVQEVDPLVEQARKLAVEDAMVKARQLAEAAGVTLGPVLTISEHGGGRPTPMAQMSMRDSGGGVPIAGGEISLNVNVSMVFAISGE